MRIGSLFSGAGGLDMAVEQVFGGEVIWQSEYNKAASKVLAYRYPCAPNFGDITAIDFKTVETPDVLCGGWPCQPFSLAGKQTGIHDERALWPFVAGAIRALRPRYIVLENVSAVLTAGEFDRVAADLAEEGYQFAWTCFRASDIGAPHQRERIFIVASDGDVEPLAGQLMTQGKADITGKPPISGPTSLLPTPCARDFKDATASPAAVARKTPSLGAVEYYLPTPAAADGQRGQGYARANREGSGGDDLVTAAVKANNTNQWGKYAPAITRWEQITGPAPAPTEPNSKGNPRLNPAFSEWMMGWPAGWVTDPDIGISRNEQLKIVGNGVCPQQAVAAIRYLLNVAVAE